MNQTLTHLPVSVPASPFSATLIKGLGLAVLSNVLFGVLYMYSGWLAPMSGTQVFLWRMVAMWVALVGLLLALGQFSAFVQYIKGLTKKEWAILVVPTPILASQFWLFMWAPVNGQGVNVAIGYFLFPLVMVLMGCVFFGERLNRLQKWAIGTAFFGVALQIVLAGSLSWASFWVCLTYPIYYGLRRVGRVPALFGLVADLTLIAPVCLAMIVWQGGLGESGLGQVVGEPIMMVLVVGLGLLSAWAMHSNLGASQLLPVNTFGILSYLEPALLFALSIVVLGEQVSLTMLASFGLIWLGVGAMIVNALKK